jgi:UDP-N-acetylmuramate--alanine ligase
MSGRRVHLIGIAGSGMSALAAALAGSGWSVSGSDREWDRGEGGDLAASLTAAGVVLLPQDGSFLREHRPDSVVVSGAVESSVADVIAARQAGLPIRHRAEVLADLVQAGTSLLVAGTSGKSTVTAMCAWILRRAGLDPTFIGGAPLVAAAAGGAPGPAVWIGAGALNVAEVDESDGSIERFTPDVAIVTNLSEDHRSIAEVRTMFRDFARRARRAVVWHARLAPEIDRGERSGVPSTTFGLEPEAQVRAESVEPLGWGSRFRVGGLSFRLGVPGRFNVENALAALAATRAFGVPDEVAAAALASFPGVHRRMERIGEGGGVTVIDDFAHNPDKVAAALETLRLVAAPPPQGRPGGDPARSGAPAGREGRLRVLFQLHGYGPARMHRAALVSAFAAGLSTGDRLYLPPVYYAGGSVTREVEASDYAADLIRRGVDAVQVERSPALADRIAGDCRSGDCVAVMGARDPSLPALARAIRAALRARGAHADQKA